MPHHRRSRPARLAPRWRAHRVQLRRRGLRRVRTHRRGLDCLRDETEQHPRRKGVPLRRRTADWSHRHRRGAHSGRRRLRAIRVCQGPPRCRSKGKVQGKSLLASWTAPASDGGFPITDYLIETSTDGVNWKTFGDGVSDETSAKITGLLGKTEYLVRIAAVSDPATGAWLTTTATTK
ncbi:hypothetical protein DAD99_08415 [Pseudarthrobacter sp. AB1]|nr:hypothetical protein [Pseudarthrobacter sp. AB1]